jgi:hypothetical protein
MVFNIPSPTDNVDGWGPCTVPEEYKDIPYAPFSKSDKLGKAADWINLGYQKYNSASPLLLSVPSACFLSQPRSHPHPPLRCRRRSRRHGVFSPAIGWRSAAALHGRCAASCGTMSEACG